MFRPLAVMSKFAQLPQMIQANKRAAFLKPAECNTGYLSGTQDEIRRWLEVMTWFSPGA